MLEEEIQRLVSESAKIKSEIAQLKTERKQLNQPTPVVRTWKYWMIISGLCILVISQIFVYVLKYGDNLMCHSDVEMDSCAKKSD